MSFSNNNGIDHGCAPYGHSPGSNGSSQGTPDVVTHLAIALARHVRDLRRRGASVPLEIDELAAIFVQYVRLRQDTTSSAEYLLRADDAPVTERLLVTKREAAERLGVSERTIDRLVAAGRLPLVHVERAARLRVRDLESFVNELPDTSAPASDADSSS